MIKKVYQFIEKYNMFSDCGVIVAGLSGGADSVCLIAMLSELVIKKRIPVHLTAVHVNHGIRGKEALRDENFSKELCEKLGVEFISRHVNIPVIAKRDGLSEEEAGRKLRYEIFNEIADMKSAEYNTKAKIAVAHHKNDQAETVLMNIVRGSSLKGLCGIQPVRGRIIRPLLCLKRSEIEKYLSLNNMSYVTDSTNADNAYTRNRVRNDLIPYMENNLNGSVVEQISDMAELVSEAESYIEKQSERLFEKSVSFNAQEKKAEIELSKFVFEPEVLQKYVIRKSIGILAEGLKDVYRTHVEAVLSLCNMQTGRQVNVAYGIKAVKTYDSIVLEKVTSGENLSSSRHEDFCSIIDRQVLERVMLGEKYEILLPQKIYLNDKKGLYNAKIVLERAENKEISKNNDYTKFFDYDRIKDNLCVRYRMTSDYIVINRTGSSKTLKKELIDRKVLCDMRSKVLLLAAGKEVLWAIGLRRSENCLVGSDTDRILKISIVQWNGD